MEGHALFVTVLNVFNSGRFWTRSGYRDRLRHDDWSRGVEMGRRIEAPRFQAAGGINQEEASYVVGRAPYACVCARADLYIA